MSLPSSRLRALAVTTVTAVAASLLLLPTTTSADAATAPAPASAPAGPLGVVSKDTVGGLLVENSFVSSVGWVKPGETYPSRILLTNTGAAPVSGAQVVVTAPTGTRFTVAGGGATVSGDGATVTWSPAAVEPTSTRTLVLESKASTLTQLPTVVWRDISSRAQVTVGGASKTLTSHGPRVIPPGETYETARYGDRPFPVVPVQYRDRAYQAEHDGSDLAKVINDPATEGSTFNLFQEMSLGQLYPEGTVPSEGIATADFAYEPGFDFTEIQPGNSCTGLTGGATAPGTVGGAGYTERITKGVYNLPGQTQYYGADANGSALIGAVAGVGALQQIDAGCGPTGKLVYDTAAIADPEIDYSDYDTDKDGVVDFFMVVFAGCGGNGASQIPMCSPATSDAAPYDNIWPHSSTLESYYKDPVTGLPGFTTDDQLKNLEGEPLWYTDDTYSEQTTTDTGDALKVFVRVGPYNVNPETAIDKASVISHEYGHSLGLPDFYSTGSRETYGDWNLMATDKSQNMDAFSRQELGWVVPQVLTEDTTVDGWTDSKQDTGTITWQTRGGTPYTLTDGPDGIVRNSEMYVAKLPGRQLLDPAKFDTGDTATKTHAWWTGSGNDFGCAPTGGHNLDFSIPELADVPAGSEVKLEFKSLWDIEWDFDYGFVLTTTDGGATYTSNPSDNGFTTSNTDPTEANPNGNGCQATFDNGITGSSGSYEAGGGGTEVLDRKAGTYPESVFKADSYDISELAGSDAGALRFSYSTDPGLARPGWFIDDIKVTVTEPGGQPREVLVSDFESSGGPEDESVYNGGCREDLTTAQQCTIGWNYVAAGAEAAADHAYYLEMRDRSGFDLDSQMQNDRAEIGFEPGLYLSYTDEAHGYGNVGTDDPPAQSPLDSQPQPGESAPDLNDAAWTAAEGDSQFSDFGEGHTDNYSDPGGEDPDKEADPGDGNWHFRYDCLSFDVLGMSGNENGPAESDGDLTGNVAFTMGEGCGPFDYGFGAAPDEDTVAPEAKILLDRPRPYTTTRVTFSGQGSADETSAPGNLTYAWNFRNGGSKVDATGPTVEKRFKRAGTRSVVLTVADEAGNSDTASRKFTVRKLVRCRTAGVQKSGGWRVVEDDRANGGAYCDNRGRRKGPDVLTFEFAGPKIVVIHGDSTKGGKALVFVDGEKQGRLSFRGSSRTIDFGQRMGFRNLGTGDHTIRIEMVRRTGYVEGFITQR